MNKPGLTTPSSGSPIKQAPAAEDEAAFEASGQTVMEVPTEIVPAIRELIEKHKAE